MYGAFRCGVRFCTYLTFRSFHTHVSLLLSNLTVKLGLKNIPEYCSVVHPPTGFPRTKPYTNDLMKTAGIS